MFKITGLIGSKKCTITYLDGHVSGNKEAVSKTLHESHENHGTLGLHPTTLDSNYLSLELPARILIEKFVFDTIESQEDDWIPPPEDTIF